MNIRWILSISFWLMVTIVYAATLPEGFVEILIAEDLDPTKMAVAPDGRLFVAEKNGIIHIIENDILLPDPVIQLEVDFFNERGLSGIAIDPDFMSNGYFYAYYSVVGEDRNRLSRFTVINNTIEANTEKILIDFEPLGGSIHNGGEMHFGPDGMLYIGIGDGDNFFDVQDMNKYTGKIIRIRPDGTVPQTNPFFEDPSVGNKAIWGLGFRNPYTFDIQKSTGDIFVNDVGSFKWEEINRVRPGGNHGWPLHEGDEGNTELYTRPFYTYGRDEGCAVIGASFYSPEELYVFPDQYHDMYFFGDYCNGMIRYIDPNNPEFIDTFATDIDRPVSIITAPNGDMYYLERAGIGGGSTQDNTSSTNGKLWKISYRGDGSPFVSVQPNNQVIPREENTCFETIAIGNNLSYQWYENNLLLDQETQADLCLDQVSLSYDGYRYYCLISDGQATISTDTVTLSVLDNLRPEASIDTRLSYEHDFYHAGDTIWFTGLATDPEDGILEGDFYTWRLDFHHDDHIHPVFSDFRGESGYFEIPRDGETSPNVFYRLTLIVSDATGTSGLSTQDIFPETSMITIDSNIPNVQILVDGRVEYTPYSYESVVGLRRYFSVSESTTFGDSIFFFDSWEDGSQETLNIFEVPTEDSKYIFEVKSYYLGDGTGLTGYYWDTIPPLNDDFYTFDKVDPLIDFNWGGGAPNNMPNDTFAISWIGTVKSYFEGSYTFKVLSDDGVRLYLNDELVIDNYVGQASTWTSADIYLEREETVNIRLDYFELIGAANVALYWTTDKFGDVVIPTRRLTPGNIYPPVLQREEAVLIAPNPTQDQLQIGLNYEDFDHGTLQVLDTQGRQVWQGNFDKKSKKLLLLIEASAWAQGVYYLKINSAMVEKTYPFIKID